MFIVPYTRGFIYQKKKFGDQRLTHNEVSRHNYSNNTLFRTLHSQLNYIMSQRTKNTNRKKLGYCFEPYIPYNKTQSNENNSILYVAISEGLTTFFIYSRHNTSIRNNNLIQYWNKQNQTFVINIYMYILIEITSSSYKATCFIHYSHPDMATLESL